ncbi:hypothetical protein [Nonomuraea longicatena]
MGAGEQQNPLKSLLEGQPTAARWREVCALGEGLTDGEVKALAAAVSRWPVAIREMPDAWWADWSAGKERPWHRLAAHRVLHHGLATGDGPRLFDGVSSAALSPDYRLAALAG